MPHVEHFPAEMFFVWKCQWPEYAAGTGLVCQLGESFYVLVPSFIFQGVDPAVKYGVCSAAAFEKPFGVIGFGVSDVDRFY